jgi:toxin ParE1/3/4
MTRRLVLTPLALEDLKDATEWYERQQEGLGDRFGRFVQDKFGEIQQAPDQFAIQFDDVRIAIVKTFPYLILFEADPGQIVIQAVYHARRNPRRWKRRR